METVSKTSAIRTAQKAHGSIWGSGSSWHFTAPHRTSQLTGPCVEVNSDSYQSALYKRARYVASTALELIGFTPDESEAWTYDQQDSAMAMVNRALKNK